MNTSDEYDEQMAFPFVEGKDAEAIDLPVPAPSSDFLRKIVKDAKNRNESPAMNRIIQAAQQK